MEKQNAVLFDLDGTLVDSNDVLISCLQTAMHDECEADTNQVRQLLGQPLEHVVAQLTGFEDSTQIERIAERYRALYQESDQSPSVFDGLVSVLDSLAAQYRLGVVTNRSVRVEKDLALTGLRSYFEVLIRGDDVANNKPHPEPLLLAADRLHTDPAQTVFVGDTASDIQAATGASMPSVLAQYGGDRYYGARLLRATAIVFQVSELPGVVDGILAEAIR